MILRPPLSTLSALSASQAKAWSFWSTSEYLLQKMEKDEAAAAGSSKRKEAGEEEVKASPVERKRLRLLRSERSKPNAAVNQDIRPSFHARDGLLFVQPYMFTYQTFAKRRWLRRKLLDVFNSEFMPRTPDFIAEQLRGGRITVNGEAVGEDYEIRDSDSIANRSHRHELPVKDAPLRVLVDTEDFLVLDKPPSWPVHPTGRFYFNSLTSVLQLRHGFRELRIAYRLDRPTSGVLVLTRNLAADQKIKRQLTERQLSKEYLALVEGEFPEGTVRVDQPLDTLLHSLGVQRVSPEGKEAVTDFRRLAFDGRRSLVAAFPKTGRTHQIRVHLQFLGFPIHNDPIYNSAVFGPAKGKGGDLGGQSVEALGAAIRAEHGFEKFETRNVLILLRLSEAEGRALYSDYQPWCPQCHILQDDPGAESVLDLHCRRYSSPDWAFEAPLPDWAARLLPGRHPLRRPPTQTLAGTTLQPPKIEILPSLVDGEQRTPSDELPPPAAADVNNDPPPNTSHVKPLEKSQ